ncbi:MAG: hypothetical protein AAF907_13880, partial [Planctomycetota bacterium]
VRALLSDPAGVREAIVVNEVLARPLALRADRSGAPGRIEPGQIDAGRIEPGRIDPAAVGASPRLA